MQWHPGLPTVGKRDRAVLDPHDGNEIPKLEHPLRAEGMGLYLQYLTIDHIILTLYLEIIFLLGNIIEYLLLLTLLVILEV